MKKQSNKQGKKVSKLAKNENLKKKLESQQEKIITVKNAEGDPDTTARIIVQNKIDYIPKVSVIIPVYNVEEYLRECLDSVVNQTLREIEIICVDDGSTDSSLDILKEYAARDKRITIIRQDNQGAGVARNAGLMVAKGEYLLILDADDVFELPFIEKLYKQSEKTNAEITICRTSLLDNETKEVKKAPWTLKSNFLPHTEVFNGEDVKNHVFTFCVGWSWDKLYRRDFVLNHKLKFQNLRSSNDLYFVFLSVVLATKITMIDDYLVKHRKNTGSSLSQTRSKDPLCFAKAMTKLKDTLVSLNLYAFYEKAFVNWAVEFCLWHAQSIDNEEAKNIVLNYLEENLGKLMDLHLNNPDYYYNKKSYESLILHMVRKKNTTADILVQNPLEFKPKVSVIIPTYNVEQYLRECLDSVVNQTLNEIEIIAVDDGSTDNSGKILDEYAAKDSRIKVIHKSNSGYGHSMNVGLDHAIGEYIGIVEPDDYIDLNMYETLYYKAKKFNLDIVKSDYFTFETIDGSYKFTKQKLIDKHSYYNVLMNPDDFPDLLLRMTTNWSGIFSKNFIKKYNIRHNETPGAAYQDNGFWVQTIYMAKRIMFLDNNFYRYRQDNPNQSIKKRNNLWTIPNEYEFIDKVFVNNKFISKYRKIYCYRKFNAYSYHLKTRISLSYWTEYLEKMADTFQKEKDQGYLDFSCFSETATKELKLILAKDFDEYKYMNIKAISIIIPVYNTEKYLRECLDSVINQTLKEIEIICVDDGSTDGSLDILNDYAKKDKRIIVLSQSNQKQGATRNRALKLAKGDFVLFLDSDDWIKPDTCENLYKKCSELNLDMLSFSGINFDTETKKLHNNPYYEFKFLPTNWNKNVFNYTDCINFLPKFAVSAALTIYRRNFLISNQISFPEKLYFEDNVFFVKAITQAQRMSIDKTIYYYRRIHSSSTTQNWNKYFSDYLKIIDLVLTYLQDIKIDSFIYTSYKNNYLNTARNILNSFSIEDQKKYYSQLQKLIKKYNSFIYTGHNSKYSFLLFPYYLWQRVGIKWKYYKQQMKEILRGLSVARVDIKNVGRAQNTVLIRTQNAKISQPAWFKNAQGVGQVVENSARKQKIIIKAIGNGKLVLNFRGQDKRFQGVRYPFWVDYKSIEIDGKEILSNPISVWHDEPFKYEMSVKNGQTVVIKLRQSYHCYTQRELRDIISKFYPSVSMGQKRLAKKLRRRIKKSRNWGKIKDFGKKRLRFLQNVKHFLFHKKKTEAYTKTYVLGICVKKKKVSLHKYLDMRLAQLAQTQAEQVQTLGKQMQTLQLTLQNHVNTLDSQLKTSVEGQRKEWSERLNAQEMHLKTLENIQAEQYVHIQSNIENLEKNITNLLSTQLERCKNDNNKTHLVMQNAMHDTIQGITTLMQNQETLLSRVNFLAEEQRDKFQNLSSWIGTENIAIKDILFKQNDAYVDNMLALSEQTKTANDYLFGEIKNNINSVLTAIEREQVLYYNPFEVKTRQERGFCDISETPDFEDRFRKLIYNLPVESVETLINIINKLKRIKNSKTKLDLFNEDEKQQLKKVDAYYKSILKISDNIYCYKNYFLPINHFEASVFFYRHGLDTLKHPEKFANKAILDVGAFIGDSALILSPLTKNKVYSFEAITENYNQLLKTIELNNLQNIVPVKSAVGAENSTIELRFAGSGTSSSSLMVNEPKYIEKCPVIKIDDYVKEHNLDVGLIKVDIEGAEQEFLKGATQTIKQQKPTLLISIYHNIDDFLDIKPLIESWNLGYSFSIYKPIINNISGETLLICE